MYIKSIVIGDINFTLDLIIKRLKDKELKHNFRMIKKEFNKSVKSDTYSVKKINDLCVKYISSTNKYNLDPELTKLLKTLKNLVNILIDYYHVENNTLNSTSLETCLTCMSDLLIYFN